jgi:hypothetical protein
MQISNNTQPSHVSITYTVDAESTCDGAFALEESRRGEEGKNGEETGKRRVPIRSPPLYGRHYESIH